MLTLQVLLVNFVGAAVRHVEPCCSLELHKWEANCAAFCHCLDNPFGDVASVIIIL
jgi:hypothetical protein